MATRSNPAPNPSEPGASRPWLRRKRVLIPAGLLALFVVAGCAGGEEPAPGADTVTAAAPTTTPASTASAEAAASAQASAQASAEAAASVRASEEAVATEEQQRQDAEAAAVVEAEAAAQAAAAEQARVADTWTVTNIVDGDTIDVEQGGTTERVRVLGIDTPERGECGFEEASSAMGSLVGGQDVLLGVEGRDDRDRYDRLIAYVDTTGGVDAGRTLIADGLAIARYDSRDGYGSHPREQPHVDADAASEVSYSCTNPAPPAEPAPAPQPADPAPQAPAPAPAGASYANCDAVRAAGAAPIRRGDPGFEPKFDRDNDGIGCDN